ncbi:MAG: HisA/HisF-related TIM barrel protein [Acidimicrobiales bacterium]
MTMQVIPAIDLLGNDAVRLERGDYDRVLFREPLDQYIARVVATHPPFVHVVDLQGARDGALRLDVVHRCVHALGAIPFQVSGGIRSVDDGRTALTAGASRIIVGTAAWETPDGLERFAATFAERLVIAVDVRDGRLAIHGWRETGGDVDEALARCRAAGVVRLHVTAIDRDGTRGGPDLDLYERVCGRGLAVVAAGGVRDDRDLAALADLGCEAAIMGVGYFDYVASR